MEIEGKFADFIRNNVWSLFYLLFILCTIPIYPSSGQLRGINSEHSDCAPARRFIRTLDITHSTPTPTPKPPNPTPNPPLAAPTGQRPYF